MQILSVSDYFGFLSYIQPEVLSIDLLERIYFLRIKTPPYCNGEVHRTKLVILVQSCNSMISGPP